MEKTIVMATNVVMPQMGESIFEGTITKWLKKVGETVEKDEPLLEISTDKVDVEIPAPVAGLLTEIKVAEGATVEINTVVAVIGGAASLAAAIPVAADRVAADPVARDLAEQAAPTIAPPVSEPSLPSPAVLAASAGAGRRLRSSPLVRRIAKDNHLDLGQVAGTGSDGRITKDDVLRFLSQAGTGSTPAPPQVAQVVPLSKMRSIIARRMVDSLAISPHVHDVFKIDMTRIVRLREREKAGFEQRNGIKLTYMPFIAAAAIEALRKFPIVNASLIDGSIHYHPRIHLGIAVALEWGLIVPVVKDAAERSFVDLARSIADLAERARTKKLKPEEAAGSTFTLSNSGIFGDEFGMPIINQPESAIMAIGALKKEAVVLTDAEGNDTIAIRSMQHFCLAYDHRTIDGADGGKFMAHLKKTLESWNREIG
jgi:2-oxoglutarate dehydrogenase E2 component (dihydrolipoamide succinyltransferase)